MNREPELKAALNNFEKLLKEYPDHLGDIMSYKHFLRSFLRVRTKSLSLPTSEVITVMKHERPNTFYLLRTHTNNDPAFQFVTGVDMDYERALKNLEEIKNSI
ncbi:hypothetical protein [Aquibacillus sediminis]|uniref:hypothetical protein n=1 Tax=Aquibacillus sediminis TaxID=2574734 RepID=UPI001109DD91|nr:hypothetical protein [Aquibacillus sediminis]